MIERATATKVETDLVQIHIQRNVQGVRDVAATDERDVLPRWRRFIPEPGFSVLNYVGDGGWRKPEDPNGGNIRIRHKLNLDDEDLSAAEAEMRRARKLLLTNPRDLIAHGVFCQGCGHGYLTSSQTLDVVRWGLCFNCAATLDEQLQNLPVEERQNVFRQTRGLEIGELLELRAEDLHREGIERLMDFARRAFAEGKVLL